MLPPRRPGRGTPRRQRRPMSTDSALDRGRKSFDRRAWGAAFAELTAADQDEPLGPEDLERLRELARPRHANSSPLQPSFSAAIWVPSTRARMALAALGCECPFF